MFLSTQIIGEISKKVAQIQNGKAFLITLHFFESPILISYSKNPISCELHRAHCVNSGMALVLLESCLIHRLFPPLTAGLGEFRIRDLNDEINKLLREKGHWEFRIKELGGPDYAVSVHWFLFSMGEL